MRVREYMRVNSAFTGLNPRNIGVCGLRVREYAKQAQTRCEYLRIIIEYITITVIYRYRDDRFNFAVNLCSLFRYSRTSITKTPCFIGSNPVNRIFTGIYSRTGTAFWRKGMAKPRYRKK